MPDRADVAVIGGGVVGAAIAREIVRRGASTILVEAGPDVGAGTSKANTAILHSGFDAETGSVEARLVRRGHELLLAYAGDAGVALERTGALVLAWTDAELAALADVEARARANGGAVERLGPADVVALEPHLAPGVLGALRVPDEGIVCPFTLPLALATEAVQNGARLLLDAPLVETRREGGEHVLRCGVEEIRCRVVVNAAGLRAGEVDRLFGHDHLRIRPRRGELLVFDKLARPLLHHVLLPVPSRRTKGILVAPTVYGNVLVGATAEDVDDPRATITTAAGLRHLRERAAAILPGLAGEEVTAAYAGLRAAVPEGDYQIRLDRELALVCVGGIRSTGVSACLAIAEEVGRLVAETGLPQAPRALRPARLPYLGEARPRAHVDAARIATDPAYGRIVCHCERVSEGEIRDALRAELPARSLDGLRRRTRASMGRCQGFHCLGELTCGLEPCARPPPLGRTTPDVVVVGAGPAGVSAAIALRRTGASVVVLDREAEAGGVPRTCDHLGFGWRDLRRVLTGPAYARRLCERALAAGVEIRTSTTALDWTGPTSLATTSPSGPLELTARAVLLATGCRERPRAARLVPGSRPSGVLTTGSLQQLLRRGVPPGRRAVIVGAEHVSFSAAHALRRAGCAIAAIVTELPRHQSFAPLRWLAAPGVPILGGTTIASIAGRDRVEAVELVTPDGPRTIACDTIVFTGDWIPEHELARAGGLVIDPSTRGPLVDARLRTSAPGVFAAGNLLRGAATADVAALEGRFAAASIQAWLAGEAWPSAPLRRVVPPLRFVTPSDGRWRFAVSELLSRATLEVLDGDRVVHRQRHRALIPNRLVAFDPGHLAGSLTFRLTEVESIERKA
jgi:L-2-hydroxyglutarate oxidase LhgO